MKRSRLMEFNKEFLYLTSQTGTAMYLMILREAKSARTLRKMLMYDPTCDRNWLPAYWVLGLDDRKRMVTFWNKWYRAGYTPKMAREDVQRLAQMAKDHENCDDSLVMYYFDRVVAAFETRDNQDRLSGNLLPIRASSTSEKRDRASFRMRLFRDNITCELRLVFPRHPKDGRWCACLRISRVQMTETTCFGLTQLRTPNIITHQPPEIWLFYALDNDTIWPTVSQDGMWPSYWDAPAQPKLSITPSTFKVVTQELNRLDIPVHLIE